MRPHDSIPDRELAAALRQLDPTAHSAPELAAITRRIVSRAAPLLNARRRRPATWWEYAAEWAGMLFPLSVATAVAAAACMAWLTIARPASGPSHAVERLALLRAVTRPAPSRELVDLALDSRTGPVAVAGARR